MSHPIAPRRVTFDRKQAPAHWIPDGPTATHVIKVPRLLLPAEEVEHRAVAFGADQHTGGTGVVRRPRGIESMTPARPAPVRLGIVGARPLTRHDPRPAGRRGDYRLRDHRDAVHRGPLPSWGVAELGDAPPPAPVVPSVAGGFAAQGRRLPCRLPRGPHRRGRRAATVHRHLLTTATEP